jgi:3-dehydroquinate synthase
MTQNIIIGKDALQQLAQKLEAMRPSQILVLSDEHTSEACYPRLAPYLPQHAHHRIPAGEQLKNLDTCTFLWQLLTSRRFDRHGLVINLGGGVLGDMGGFVAATYKRGIRFIQVPTTLLAMVDASVGGKLGIDFNDYKNHIGLFANPETVIIWPQFLETLPEKELRSGYAEVIKHCLIADAAAWQGHLRQPDWRDHDWEEVIPHSVEIKADIVARDMREAGERMALNFGHTIGHAIETFCLTKGTPLMHGEAIALGIVAESWLSMKAGLIGEQDFLEIKSFIKRVYPEIKGLEGEEGALWEIALQDKKNKDGIIRCTLIEGPGNFRVKQSISYDDFHESLGLIPL